MNNGRESGWYVPVFTVSAVGATHPSPPSTDTSFSLSWFAA